MTDYYHGTIPIIDDTTDPDFLFKWRDPDDAAVRARGAEERNYTLYPPDYLGPPSEIKEIPQSEWSDRIKQKNETKSALSHMRLTANNGSPIPSLDQGQVGYCLPPGAPVRMADNTYKPIENVQLGDSVLASRLRPKKVVQLHQRLYTGYMITLRVEGIERPIVLTADHLVPTPTAVDKHRWHDRPASQFSLGMEVYGLIDQKLGLHKIRSVKDKYVINLPVFDIGVEDDHYFFTGDDILVHNCWGHSTCHDLMLVHALMGLPYVPLSAYSVCSTIMNGADRGGWCGLSLKYMREKGCAPQSMWPQGNRSKKWSEVAEAALSYRPSEDYYDLQRQEHSQQMSFSQVATLLLSNVPVALDFNWWGHSVCGLDLVETEPGSFGILIWNSWGERWGDKGMGVLKGTQARPNGAVGVRVMPAFPGPDSRRNKKAA